METHFESLFISVSDTSYDSFTVVIKNIADIILFTMKLKGFKLGKAFGAVCTYGSGQKHFRHLERSHLSSMCVTVYNVIRWTLCELKRDLLYFLNICNDIIS